MHASVQAECGAKRKRPSEEGRSRWAPGLRRKRRRSMTLYIAYVQRACQGGVGEVRATASGQGRAAALTHNDASALPSRRLRSSRMSEGLLPRIRTSPLSCGFGPIDQPGRWCHDALTARPEEERRGSRWGLETLAIASDPTSAVGRGRPDAEDGSVLSLTHHDNSSYYDMARGTGTPGASLLTKVRSD